MRHARLAVAVSLVAAGVAQAEYRPIAPGATATGFVITPDGSRVVFESPIGDQTVLRVVPVDGSGGAVVLSPSGESSYLFNAAIAPDSSAVVFNTHEFLSDGLYVSTYSNLLKTPTVPTPLNSSRIYDDDPSQYNLGFSPDSRRAIIRADRGDYAFDLLSRPVDGSGPGVAINPNPEAGAFGEGVFRDWTLLGDRALFTESSARNLFVRPVDASAPAIQLNPVGEGAGIVASHPSSPVVVFTTTAQNLYARPLDGGPVVPLLVSDGPGSQSFRGVDLAADGRNAVITSNDYRLLTIATDGSAAAAKSLLPFPFGIALGATISPDGSAVAFIAREDTGLPAELYIAPIDGSAPAKKLNGPLPAGGDIGHFEFSPDGSRIVYFGDQVTDGVEEIFSVPADGSRTPTRLGALGSFLFTPDGRYVVLGGPGYFQPELDLVPIDGGEAIVLATRPFATGGIHQFALSEDGSTLVFSAADATISRSELFALDMPAGAVPEPAVLPVMLAAFALVRRRPRRRDGIC